MLVSTLMPIISGGFRPARAAASRAAVAAACIIAVPPEACTSIIHAPVCTRGVNRLRYGVRDVVKLEVEEYAAAARDQFLDQRRAFEGEEAASDLHAVGDAFERGGQFERASARFDVERDEQPVSGH